MHHDKQDLKEAAEAQYSKKLRKVIAKIKKIIKSNDIAGSVVLYEPGFSEYLVVIDPIYSKIRFGDKPGQMVIMDDLQRDYYGDEKLRRESLEGTMNMLIHMANMNRLLFQNFNNMAGQVEKRADFGKLPGDKKEEKPEAPVVQMEKANPAGKICVEPGCGEPAVDDFNGMGAWGCQKHLDEWYSATDNLPTT